MAWRKALKAVPRQRYHAPGLEVAAGSRLSGLRQQILTSAASTVLGKKARTEWRCCMACSTFIIACLGFELASSLGRTGRAFAPQIDYGQAP
jgi:hypothetical protein